MLRYINNFTKNPLKPLVTNRKLIVDIARKYGYDLRLPLDGQSSPLEIQGELKSHDLSDAEWFNSIRLVSSISAQS